MSVVLWNLGPVLASLAVTLALPCAIALRAGAWPALPVLARALAGLGWPTAPVDTARGRPGWPKPEAARRAGGGRR